MPARHDIFVKYVKLQTLWSVRKHSVPVVLFGSGLELSNSNASLALMVHIPWVDTSVKTNLQFVVFDHVVCRTAKARRTVLSSGCLVSRVDRSCDISVAYINVRPTDSAVRMLPFVVRWFDVAFKRMPDCRQMVTSSRKCTSLSHR